MFIRLGSAGSTAVVAPSTACCPCTSNCAVDWFTSIASVNVIAICCRPTGAEDPPAGLDDATLAFARADETARQPIAANTQSSMPARAKASLVEAGLFFIDLKYSMSRHACCQHCPADQRRPAAKAAG